MELLRLAIARRVDTQSHLDYVIEANHAEWRRRDHIRGLELIYQAPTSATSPRAFATPESGEQNIDTAIGPVETTESAHGNR